MSAPVHVEQSRSYPVTVETAYDRLLLLPLPELFTSWFGPLPPVRSTDQDGVWGTVGQERTIHLGDGGSMRERLVATDRPRIFTYEITGFRGALRPLVDRVEGSWVDGTGARVTWTWDLHPHGRAGRLLVPVVVRFWPGYARAALARLEPVLLR